MMNILEIQDALKNMSNEQLIREIRMPSGSAPPFLVASEMDRRQNMRQRFAEKQPQSTVIDDLTMQMNQGIGGMMPQPMPTNQPMGMPKSSPELMPARRMAAGGLASAISDAIAPVLAKAQADAVGGITNTFVGDTSPMTDMAYRSELGNRLRSGPSYPVTNFPITNPDTVMDRPRLGASPNPRPTAPIMGKGSNPNMAIPSLGAAAFGRTPARGMAVGGLAALGRFLGLGAKPATRRLGPGATVGSADDILVSPAGIASRRNQGIGSTIPPNQQLIPYSAGNVIPYQPSVSAGAASPSLFQKGLGALRTGGKFLLGATPVAGLQNLLLTSSMGDGTMVAKIMSDFGLTEEEALLLEQELLKRGKDFYTDKQELQPFADSIIATRPGGPGLKTEQEMAVEQQKQKEKTLIDMLRERDERNRSIAGLQTGLDLIARGAAGEPLGTALPASVGKIFLPALSKMGETELKLMLDRETRKAAALAKQKGTTKDLIDYRQDLAKQLTDPTTSLALTAEQKKIISDTLERLDAIIQSRVGIGSSGGTSSLDTMEAIRAALGAKTASVKG